MGCLLRSCLPRIIIIILWYCGHYSLLASSTISSRTTTQHPNQTLDRSHLEASFATQQQEDYGKKPVQKAIGRPAELERSSGTDDYYTTESTNDTVEDPQSNIGIIVGVIFAFLFLIVLAGMAVYFRENIRKNICLVMGPLQGNIEGIPLGAADSDSWTENPEVPEDTCKNQPFRMTWGQIEVFLSTTMYSFETEERFKSVPRSFGKSVSIAELPENIAKNRYKGILPYDDGRVVLSNLHDGDFSDYINASYIPAQHGRNDYIASQGPKDFNVNTIPDFWRMIRELNCPAIVMVTNLMERGMVKVGKYWPDIDKTMDLENGIQVKALADCCKMEYHIRSFQLTFQGTSQQVFQYHYTAWPDHGVPAAAYCLSHMVRTLRTEHPNPGGPIVVHCSAGIGRTGTVLLMLTTLDQLKYQGYIDSYKNLLYLRQRRAFLVENVEQFRFAHKLLDEFLFGISYSIPCEQYVSKLKELRTLDSTGSYELAEQYKKLKTSPKDLTFMLASNPKVAHMNRSLDILPADARSVFLQILDGQEETQYINAVRVNGFVKQDQYIATEYPQAHTLSVFWRMVYEKKSTVVVLLTSIEDENFIPLIPAIPEQESWMVNVHVTSIQTFTNFKEVIVSVFFKSAISKFHKVQLLIFTAWPPGCIVPSSSALLTMLEHLEPMRNDSPIVLCCPDGVTGCGLTAALLHVLAKLQYMREVDVYHAVQTVLHDRPQFINDLTQLEFLYDAALNYLQKFMLHKNFF